MKTFITNDERKDIEDISVEVKEKIVTFIKEKYHVELCNIDWLVQAVIKSVLAGMAKHSDVKNGNMLKAAEKFYLASGIKTKFQEHSLYGFARSMDYKYYTVTIPKHRMVTNLKYWLVKKLLK